MEEQKAATGPRPDETVLWEGWSERGLTFDAFDGPLLAIGLFLVVIGAGMVAQARLLVGLPVLALGCYLGGGFWIYEALQRRNTRYVLTPDRAYLVRWWPRRRTVVVDLRRCGPIGLAHHRDGTGTITFGRARARSTWFGPLRWSRPAFRYIVDAPALMPVMRGEADRVELPDLEPEA